MTPADQVHRRQAVEKALIRLTDGQRYARKALFSKIGRWQDSLLVRLETLGAIKVERGKRANVYQVADHEKINQLLIDEESFLMLVFPSHTHSEPDGGEQPDDTEQESDLLTPLELPQYSGEELQTAQLQMLAGIAQLLGQLDVRLAAVETDTSEIRKALLE